MTLFPSPLERTVASALLLLSNSDLLSPRLQFDADSDSVGLEDGIASKSSCEESLSFVSSASKSLSSSLTSDGSSNQTPAAHKLTTVAHEMQFKVVKKRRSKVCWSFSYEPKVVLGLPVPVSSRSESTEASCLSSTSSAASSTRNRHLTRSGRGRDQREDHEKAKKTKMHFIHGSGSAYMRRQAEAILKLLSRGCFSEVTIRQQLGDSPDTSKALRMLLKKEEIKRSGTGGRSDPYIYRIA